MGAMRDESSLTCAFERNVAALLRDNGFGMPRSDQARVLIFEATSLTRFAGTATDFLDRRERARAMRFRFRRDHDTYVLAHAVWRIALAGCLEVDPREVPLATTSDGQPRLAGTALSTSLSHSGDLIAIAICPAATIGLDIERFPARIDLDALMPVFCTREECVELSMLQGSERARSLLELWTRKEALLKAFGVGLLTDPATTPAPSMHSLMPPANAAHYPPCHTRNLHPGKDWIAAVAAPSAIRDIQLHIL